MPRIPDRGKFTISFEKALPLANQAAKDLDGLSNLANRTKMIGKVGDYYAQVTPRGETRRSVVGEKIVNGSSERLEHEIHEIDLDTGQFEEIRDSAQAR